MPMSTECPICICEYDNPYECEYCEHKCCFDCQQHYMKDELVCMNCKFPVDLTRYRFDTFDCLNQKINLERSFIPLTKKYVAMDAKKVELLQEKKYFEDLGCRYAHSYYSEKIKKIAITDFVECLFCGKISFDDGEEIICACDIKQCSRCKQIKHPGKEHACDENLVLSESEISSMRKCPCCGVPIFKVDGCYQILCTNCRCVFDYNTGRLDYGNVHSPAIYSMIASLEKESLVKPRNWKSDSMFFKFDKLSKLIVKTGKLNINADVRLLFVEKKISEREFVKATIKSYMRMYDIVREIKFILRT